MKPTLAGSPVAQMLCVTGVLIAVGTFSVSGQVPQKAAQAAPHAVPPVYPSATYDAQTSAQMSAGMGGGRDSFFVYLSGDPAAKVAAFYAAKLGRKAEKVDEGSFAFHLTDQGGMPDLTIESNLMGPLAGKTVITVVKHQR